MNRISTVAFAAALLGGTMVSAPSMAKEKPQAAADGLKLSEPFRKVAAPAQTAMQAKDYATAEPLVAQAQAAATTDDEKYVAAALRYDLENAKLYAAQDANPKAPVNETVLAAPLDVLIANPRTPADARARYSFRRGALAFNSRQYPQALQYFQHAKQLGYTDSDIDLQIIKAKMESGDVAGGSADLQSAIGRMTAAGQKAPEAYYRYAIARSNSAKDKNATMTWLTRYGAAYPTAQNWRDIVVMYGLQQQPIETIDETQKLDLYRLLHDTRSLSDQSIYEQYATTAMKRGFPSEAASVLREGQQSGKLTAAATAATLSRATQAAKAEGSLASLDARARTSPDGKLASQTADAYLGQGQPAKAADLYRIALTKGGVNADDVKTHLGIALSRSGDKAGAQTAFAAVKGAPRANIAALWVAWLNTNAA
jgi:predicted NAD-dependent protein-ADP-ribosyltransferase YbiA (DUF1768 family)